ncbi:hypothetical protein, partial [Joostella sp. CR20]|uniref:hypothetical protein n=1 Tax=Joostella sp. CR20 TaxID=2804312 RepID=UPI00313AEEEE
ATNAENISDNADAIAEKEDASNKSTDGTLSDATNTKFPTELAVKTYVDNSITASEQTVVSADEGNSIEKGTDGGAFYDDSTLQTSVATNTNAIATNTEDITSLQNNKEDASNKSDDTALGTSSTLFPTQNAVKTYVDNQISSVAEDDDITSAELDESNNLNIKEGTTEVSVDLSSLDNSAAVAAVQDDLDAAKTAASIAISNLQSDVDANETAIANHITDDKDTDASNELQDLSLNGDILTLSTPKTTDNQVDLSALDNQTASEVEITTIDGVSATDVQGALEELNTNSTDNQTASEVDITTIDGVSATTVQEALEVLNTNSTDDQNASEVTYNNEASGLEATNTQAAIDEVSGTAEQALEEVNKISKAAKVFYPPSIAIDASTPSTEIKTLDLYQQYKDQFATPAVSSAGAPSLIPTYSKSDLYYYVTEYDTNVFTIIGIDADGIMSYRVDNSPSDYNSLINVVFVVK